MFRKNNQKPKMLIQVLVKVKQKKAEIIPDVSEVLFASMPIFNAKIKSLQVNGEANQELVDLLSKYFKLPKSQIVLKKGHTSHNKIFGIQEKF